VNLPSNVITLIAGIVLTLICLWYGQNHGLMPIAASALATQVDELFNFMMTIATGLFLIVEGVLIFSIFKFRRRKGDLTDGPPIEGNISLEIVWTAIPAVIVLILAVYSFEVYNNMGGLDPKASRDMGTEIAHHHHSHSQPHREPSLESTENLVAFDPDGKQVALGLGTAAGNGEEETLEVDVSGMQYAWLFTYGEQNITSGELHVPVNRQVKLNISAVDVIHAFWVPELRVKQDAVPGRNAILTFTPNRLGEYPIICAELCGSYHGGMKTYLYVETEEEYQQWLAENTFEEEYEDYEEEEFYDEAVALNNEQ